MVKMVVQEFMAPDKCDITAAINPAITSPTNPDGSKFSTNVANNRSGLSRTGNNFGATSAGNIMSRGSKNFR
ncbi:hypothetical protein D3C87_1354460 [compost metagenome]